MEILGRYTDTDGKEWIYYSGGLANGPINLSFSIIKCCVCEKKYEEDSFNRTEVVGIPAYYKGDPRYPTDAEEYYCSANCATIKNK